MPQRADFKGLSVLVTFAKRLFPAFLMVFVVATLAVLDGWYQRSDYMTDAISYLDISKAIQHGDWSLVFNPYWSIGYPLILTATRGLFPAGPQGEWMAIHVINLVIFLSTYLSFLYLLKAAQDYLARVQGVEAPRPVSGFVVVIGTALFVLLQLLVATVARVNPDLLVNGIFFLATAESLRFAAEPRIKRAVFLGLIMGFGYLVKAIFLSLAVFLLLGALLLALSRPRAERAAMIFKLAWALPVMAILIVPYIAANSINAGFFTLGETSSLNYAWNVNHLPVRTHWQGGPEESGMPIHPTKMLLRTPPVFEFGEPFHVTYSPWFNPFYWNQGYHRFFNAGNELDAIKANLEILRQFFLRGPKAIAAFVLVALTIFFFKERNRWWKRLLALYPVYLPSILAIGGYMMVVIEPRYLVGFWIILLTVPFIALFAPAPLLSRRACYAGAALIVLGCTAVVAENEKEIFDRAIHHQSYLDSPHWRTGLYLTRMGLRPGDKVASVHGGMTCSWAEISGVRVVTEIPQIAVSSISEDELDKDFKMFEHDPALQQTVFALFKQAGATVAVMMDADEPLQGPGWEQVPGTTWWVHRL